MSGRARRRLIWVPIIHTQADLGSVSGSVKALHARKTGLGNWDRHVATIDEFWGRICREIEALHLDYAKVRLYQDGLPNCGQELRIVKDLVEAGSWNHRLLLDLVEKGAQLTGTESPELLIEEYELVRGVLKSIEAGGKGELDKQQAEHSRDILRKRDRYIAQRIGDTLQAGQTGLIFLGLLHDLQTLLPRDIRLNILGQAAGDARKTHATERTVTHDAD